MSAHRRRFCPIGADKRAAVINPSKTNNKTESGGSSRDRLAVVVLLAGAALFSSRLPFFPFAAQRRANSKNASNAHWKIYIQHHIISFYTTHQPILQTTNQLHSQFALRFSIKVKNHFLNKNFSCTYNDFCVILFRLLGCVYGNVRCVYLEVGKLLAGSVATNDKFNMNTRYKCVMCRRMHTLMREARARPKSIDNK